MSDLIDRQAAIDSIMEEPSEARYPVFYAEKIKQLPSAQPDLSAYFDRLWKAAYERGKAEQRWIPCSERLPEETGIYPVWTARGFGNHLSTSYWDGKEWSLRVVAWMPLPTPYRKEREDAEKAD